MIVVFGQTGQVARELARIAPAGTLFLGRDAAELSVPGACAAAIARYRPAVVINAAAWTAVDRAETDEAAAHQVNAAAPTEMARACAGLGAALVHLSTDYVFDGQGSTPFAPDAPMSPINAYGRTKAAGEDGVRAAGARHAILRTSWVFSAHGSNFVRTMLRLGSGRDRLGVVADQIGAPTPAADIARACLVVAGHLHDDPHLSGTWHYAGAPDVSWANFARDIMRGAGLTCEIDDIATADYPTPARRPANSRLACPGLDAFGLRRPDWRAGLAHVLHELKVTQ